MDKSNKEVLELCKAWFEDIMERCDRLTSGNVSHGSRAIHGVAKNSIEYIEEHLKVMKDEMSKAEIEAKKRYGISRGDDIEETSSIDMQRASDFIEGYHQAEKDLKLTWEDIRELYIIFSEVDTEIELCKTDIKTDTLGYYKEVLERFNKKRK